MMACSSAVFTLSVPPSSRSTVTTGMAPAAVGAVVGADVGESVLLLLVVSVMVAESTMEPSVVPSMTLGLMVSGLPSPCLGSIWWSGENATIWHRLKRSAEYLGVDAGGRAENEREDEGGEGQQLHRARELHGGGARCGVACVWLDSGWSACGVAYADEK